MKDRRAVGLLNPMRDTKLRGEPGGGREDICTTACPEVGKWKCAKKKKRPEKCSGSTTFSFLPQMAWSARSLHMIVLCPRAQCGWHCMAESPCFICNVYVCLAISVS